MPTFCLCSLVVHGTVNLSQGKNNFGSGLCTSRRGAYRCGILLFDKKSNYPTRVRSLAMLLSLTHWLIHSLTHSCIVNLNYVALACEDAYSKLVEVCTRAEKSKSLIWWKRREKAEKADVVMQLAFWQKCQNAIKWQNACTSGQGPASEYFF